MRRRDLLLGAGSLAVLGGGAAVSQGWIGGAEGRIDPVDLETIEAPGSPGGATTVPEPGRVTFVKLFATWCTVCKGMMPAVAAAHGEVDDDVQFLSVTSEPVGTTISREDVAEWWIDHDGGWPVALDTDYELTGQLEASGVPYAYVLDADNRVVWEHRGDASAEELLAGIRTATGSDGG